MQLCSQMQTASGTQRDTSLRGGFPGLFGGASTGASPLAHLRVFSPKTGAFDPINHAPSPPDAHRAQGEREGWTSVREAPALQTCGGAERRRGSRPQRRCLHPSWPGSPNRTAAAQFITFGKSLRQRPREGTAEELIAPH